MKLPTGVIGRLRPTGLRARLLIAFAAVALLASTLTAGIAYVLVRRSTLERAEESTVHEFRRTVEESVPGRLPDLRSRTLLEETVFALLPRFVKPGWGVRVEAKAPGEDISWEDSDSQDLVPEIPAEMSEAVRRHKPREGYEGSRLVHQRVVSGGEPYLIIGTRLFLEPVAGSVTETGIEIYVVVSLRKEAENLDAVARAGGFAGGGALVIALIIGMLAAAGVLRPVRQLGAAARSLGRGKLDTSVAVKGRDELADLARTFNFTAAELRRSIEELRDMEAAARRFVADVSHELRTPLTSMVAMADTLEEETPEGPSAVAAALVSEETRRLRTLVEHLIEISRFDAGAAELVLDDIDAAQLVTECLRRRGWTGEVETDLESVRARLDPRRFEIIVANLVGNALKHGAPPVTVRLSREATWLVVRVADHGEGVPEEARRHVFERFFKVESARTRSEGSGLGLAIARSNAELHGGSLVIVDATSFEARIPVGET